MSEFSNTPSDASRLSPSAIDAVIDDFRRMADGDSPITYSATCGQPMPYDLKAILNAMEKMPQLTTLSRSLVKSCRWINDPCLALLLDRVLHVHPSTYDRLLRAGDDNAVCAILDELSILYLDKHGALTDCPTAFSRENA